MKKIIIFCLSLLLVYGCSQDSDNADGASVSISASGLSDGVLALNASATFTAGVSNFEGDVSTLNYRWSISTGNGGLSDGTNPLSSPTVGGNTMSCVGKFEGDEEITVEVLDEANMLVATASYAFIISPPNIVASCFDQPKLIYSYNGVNSPYICNFDGTDAQSLPFNFSVSISPDGQWFGYNQDLIDGFYMKLQRCDGSESVTVPESMGRDFRPRFSPDSKTLYFQRPNPLQPDLSNAATYADIAAYDLETGQVNFITSLYQSEEGVNNITVDPVSGRIAFIRSIPMQVGSIFEYTFKFSILNPNNGVITDLYTFPPDTLNIRGMDWSPQGDNVIFSARLGTGEQGFFRINVTDDSQPFLIYPELDPDFVPPLNPTYYNGGTRIAFADALNGQTNSNIWSIDVNGGDLQQITDTPGQETMRSVYRH